MATPNLTDFEQRPPTKVGRATEQFVKSRFEKRGFEVADHSKEKNAVDFIVSKIGFETIINIGVEVKARRITSNSNGDFFRLELQNWGNIINYAKRNRLTVFLNIVTLNGEGLIYTASLDALKNTSLSKEVYEFMSAGKKVTKECINLPVSCFKTWDRLTQAEIEKIDQLVKEMDDYNNNPQAKLPVTTIDDLEKQIKEDADRRAANPTLFDEPTPLKFAIKDVADEKKFDPTPYLEFVKMAKDESFDEPAQARSTDEQGFFYGQSDARP